jgi:hypothetical protein
VDFRAVDFLRPVDFFLELVDLRLVDLRAVDFLRERVDFFLELVDLRLGDFRAVDFFRELVDFFLAVDFFLLPPVDFFLPPPEALPPRLDAPGELEIAAARPLLMPFFLRPSYCLSFLTLEPWSFAIRTPSSCELRTSCVCTQVFAVHKRNSDAR